MEKSLSLIELNEINFDIVEKYISAEKGKFLGFQKIFDLNRYTSSSEEKYEHIEPWIQWVSAHTEKTFEEHKVYRLGDIVHESKVQIFELVEQMGFKVGCISPMNTSNRLKKPAFFIPDPWTNTSSDESLMSKLITSALKQTVNDNAVGNIKLKSRLSLLFALILYSNLNNWKTYVHLFLNRHKKWYKALFLDLFLSDLFINYSKRRKVHFNCLFLNAFAHIQHNYFFNSRFAESENINPELYISEEDDPIYDAIKIYDKIILNFFKLKSNKKIFATGLRQTPIEKPVIYYRLKNHHKFLSECGLKNFRVETRMTRDFQLTFFTKKSEKEGIKKLRNLSINGNKVFGVIDQRNDSLFLTLTFSKIITENTFLNINKKRLKIKEYFAFVSYKNGHHDGLGYIFTDLKTSIFKNPKHPKHIKNLGTEIKNFFQSNFT